MNRLGIVLATATALLALACAGSTHSGKTASSTAAAGPTAAASAAAGTPTRTVVGRVALIDRANDLTLAGTEAVGLAFDKFKIADGTPVTLNGQHASVADIRPGDEVRASFVGSDADAHVQKIEILPSSTR